MMATRVFLLAYIRLRLIRLLLAVLRRVPDTLNTCWFTISCYSLIHFQNKTSLLTRFIQIILIFVLNSTVYNNHSFELT